MLFHLLLLVSTKSCCQQCLGGGGGGGGGWTAGDRHPHQLSVTSPGWISRELQAPSSQLPDSAHLHLEGVLPAGWSLPLLLLFPACPATVDTHPHPPPPREHPRTVAAGLKFNPVWIPPWEGGPPSHYVPSFRLSLGPTVFFGVLFTPLSIISDIGNNSFTSGDQAGVTFRPRDSGDCLDMFSAVTTGEGGSSAPSSQCAGARDAANKHPQGKNIPLNSDLSSPKYQQLLRLSNPASWSAFLVEMTVWVFFFSSWTVTDAEVEKEMQTDKLNQTLGSFLTRLLS